MKCFRCTTEIAEGAQSCGDHIDLWRAYSAIAPRVRSAADYLLSTEETATDWVWGMEDAGLMANGEFIGIGAFSGDGKTALIFGLCAALSTGTRFIGQETKGPLSSLIITETSARQVKRLLQHNERQLDAGQITIVQSTRIPHQVFSFLIDTYKPDVLCIDSLTAIAPALRLHGNADFDWQTPTHMTTVSLWLRELQQVYNIKLMIGTAHTVKASRRTDAGEPNLDWFRGTGGVVEQMDQAYIYKRSKPNLPGCLFNVKSRSVDETMKQLRFHYDEDTGLYSEIVATPAQGEPAKPHVPWDVMDVQIIEAIKAGHRSSSRVADYLKYNKNIVCLRINDLLRNRQLERAVRNRNLYVKGEVK